MMKCRHGCNQDGPDEDVRLHERTCERRQVPCIDGWCVEVIPLNGLIEHIRAQHCGKRVTASAEGLVRQTWFLSREKWDKSELDATWTAPYCHFSGNTFLPRFLKQ